MPQFEFYTFSGQNFYFLLSFCIVYFLIAFFFLPYTAEVLKMRKKLINRYGIKNANKKKLNLLGIFIDIYLNRKIEN